MTKQYIEKHTDLEQFNNDMVKLITDKLKTNKQILCLNDVEENYEYGTHDYNYSFFLGDYILCMTTNPEEDLIYICNCSNSTLITMAKFSQIGNPITYEEVKDIFKNQVVSYIAQTHGEVLEKKLQEKLLIIDTYCQKFLLQDSFSTNKQNKEMKI